MSSDNSKKSAQELAELLNNRFGAKTVTTGVKLDQTPKPKNWPLEFLDGKTIETKSGEAFVRTEFFSEKTLHGSFPIKRLEELPGEKWLDPDCPTSQVTDPEKLVFLDTETTGLGRNALPFLIGLGRWKSGEGFYVHQLFLSREGSEAAHFKSAAKSLEDAGAIVTYNGDSYDMPLLEAGFLRNRLIYTPGDLPHLDLLPHARAHYKRKTGSAKLTALERFALHFSRVDDVPGSLIPPIYSDYLRHGHLDKLEGVFLHNALDILSLAALMVLTPPKPKVVKSAERPLTQAQERTRAKKLIAELQKSGEYDQALKEARKLIVAGFGGHPYPYLEAAKILEKGLGDPEEALFVLEEALQKRWIPKDRALLEKYRDKLVNSTGN